MIEDQIESGIGCNNEDDLHGSVVHWYEWKEQVYIACSEDYSEQSLTFTGDT